MDGNFRNVVGGRLKLKKGALEPSGGVSQKKRKAKKRRKSASPPLDAAEVQEQQEQAGERTAPKGEAPIGSGFNKTEAQKRHERFMRQKEEQQIEKYAAKSHQQKVKEFNEHLASLTEANDIPKVDGIAKENYKEALETLDLSIASFAEGDTIGATISGLPAKARDGATHAGSMAVLITQLDSTDTGDGAAVIADPTGATEATITADAMRSGSDVVEQGSALILSDVPLLLPRISGGLRCLPIIDASAVLQVFPPRVESAIAAMHDGQRNDDDGTINTYSPTNVAGVAQHQQKEPDTAVDSAKDDFW